jgi:hypothetical protein
VAGIGLLSETPGRDRQRRDFLEDIRRRHRLEILPGIAPTLLTRYAPPRS